MAVQTKQVVRISRHSQVQLQVFMEYHDDDYRVVNDDGDPDDFRVIRWFGENLSSTPVNIQILRSGGRKWRDFVIPTGTFSQDAGGAVKYEFDVPEWRYS